MKQWIDICKNCGKEFLNKSDYQRRPSLHCSFKCRCDWKYKNRKNSGNIKEYNSRPEVRLKKSLWAREHPETNQRWRRNHLERSRSSTTRSGYRKRGYPDEFFMIKYIVKARDKNKCVVCGEKNRKKLVVHHIDKDKKNNDLSNLETLCRVCHGVKHRHNLILNRYIKERMVD